MKVNIKAKFNYAYNLLIYNKYKILTVFFRKKKSLIKRHNYFISKGLFKLALLSLLQIKHKTKQDRKRINRLSHCLQCLSPNSNTQQYTKTLPLNSSNQYKNILLVVHNSFPYDSAGYAHRTLHEAKAYQAHGYHVIIATRLGYPWDLAKHRNLPKKRHQWVDGVEIITLTGIRQYKVDSDIKYALQYAGLLADIICERQIDLLQASSNYINGLAAYFAGRKCHIPFIYEARGMWHITGGSKSSQFKTSEQFRYEEIMERFVLNHASANIFITECMKNHYQSLTGIPNLVLKNCVDIKEINANYPKLHYQQGLTFKLLYAGSLVFYEGLELLINTVAELSAYKITLDIMGDGRLKADIEKHIKALDTPRIRYHGKLTREALTKLYSQYHGVIVPRIKCDVTQMVPPLKPLEALSHGVPVIVSSLPALREQLTDLQSVLYCEPGSLSSLKKQIIHLMTHHNDILKQVQKDIILIKKEKTWDIEITKITKLMPLSPSLTAVAES
ncbi:glycosyltransferase [uncultured Shewanella sp.]|uniref:glycosyltransferase n=1 Tax=uncultured Shewanella sp. TaxID=173975 RepID=UPI00260D2FF8|nr:glycosyltransferase [uncultured Shewanella sp.]